MVKVLNRDKIRRFFDVEGGSGTGGGSSIDPSMLVGLATETWVDENYLSIAYFSQLFKAYKPGENAGDPDVEVLPNTIDEDITNVKSMFGFWTEFYLSALGTGGASSVGISLASLSDVDVTGVTNGQFLKWDSTQSKWVPGTASGGTDMATVWANLAAVDATHQIDASHMSNAALGLFTSLAMDGNDLSITIGGVNKTLTVGYATKANLLNSNYNNGESSWVWNPFGLSTQIWVWGQSFKDTNIGSDSGDLRFYLTPSNEAGGVALCMNIDGPIASLSKIYASGFMKNGINDNYVLLGGGGDSLISNLSVGSAAQLTATRTIWGQNFNGTANVTGDLYLNGSNLGLYGTPGLSNSCYISGYYSSGYKIGFAVGGTAVVEISSAGVYSTSGVTALSDIRFKNVVERMDIDVKRIAEMSIIKFLWNDRDEGGKLHVGCVAQEWESLLPWTVQEVNGKKSLDYSVAALVSAVAVARKMESHEERIARLERELVKERALLSKESGRKGD